MLKNGKKKIAFPLKSNKKCGIFFSSKLVNFPPRNGEYVIKYM
jgi:hypothetical protein